MTFHCWAEAGSSRSTPSEDVRNIKNYCKQKTPKAFQWIDLWFDGVGVKGSRWCFSPSDSRHLSTYIYSVDTNTGKSKGLNGIRVQQKTLHYFKNAFLNTSQKFSIYSSTQLTSLGRTRIQILSLLENQIKPNQNKQPPFGNTWCLPPALFSSDQSFVCLGYWLCLYCRQCTQSAVCCGGGRRNHYTVQPPLGEWCQQPLLLVQCMSTAGLCLHWFFT